MKTTTPNDTEVRVIALALMQAITALNNSVHQGEVLCDPRTGNCLDDVNDVIDAVCRRAEWLVYYREFLDFACTSGRKPDATSYIELAKTFCEG